MYSKISEHLKVTNRNLAIFASGGGSNAEQFFTYFRSNKNINIRLLLTNNKNAFAIKRAEKYEIPTVTFTRSEFYESDHVIKILTEHDINLIVLAGFLWKITEQMIAKFPNKIINIHPALLPKFGGKGMYGKYVHEAVVNAGEKESGITIHYVNSNYDEGKIIFQEKCNVEANDTPELLAEKVLKLEHLHFPRVVGQLLSSL